MIAKLNVIVGDDNSDLKFREVLIKKCSSKKHGEAFEDCVCHLKGEHKTIQEITISNDGTEYYKIRDGWKIRFLSRDEFLTRNQEETSKKLKVI